MYIVQPGGRGGASANIHVTGNDYLQSIYLFKFKMAVIEYFYVIFTVFYVRQRLSQKTGRFI